MKPLQKGYGLKYHRLPKIWRYLIISLIGVMLLAALLLRHKRPRCGHSFWVIRGVTDIGHDCPLFTGMNMLALLRQAQVQYRLCNGSYAPDYDRLMTIGADPEWLEPDRYVKIRCHFGADHWVAVLYDDSGKMRAIAGDSIEPQLVH